jgi:hypothetical protein
MSSTAAFHDRNECLKNISNKQKKPAAARREWTRRTNSIKYIIITFCTLLQVPFNSINSKLELLLISSLPLHVIFRLFMHTIVIDRLIVITIAANEVNKHMRLTVNLQLPRNRAAKRTINILII